MLIYLDFEANTYTNEIIQIGAVKANGEEFRSLVRPHCKIDRKIKELTGISQEAADAAPYIDPVAIEFFKWATSDGSPITFMTYGGDHDKKFVEGSLMFCCHPEASDALGFVRDRIVPIDRAVAVKFHRREKEGVSLQSAYLTMKKVLGETDLIDNAHDALADARMTMYVHQHIADFELPEGEEIIKVESKVQMWYGKKVKAPRDPKYMVPVHVTKTKNGVVEKEWNFTNFYSALSLAGRNAVSTPEKKEKVLRSLYNATVTGDLYLGKQFYFA